MNAQLGKILISEDTIKNRVAELGAEITRDYKIRGVEEITIIAIMNGAIFFAADLMRKIDLQVSLECVKVRSYKDKTESLGTPEILDCSGLNIAGKHILLIDDIVDTGKTSDSIIKLLKSKQATDIRTCMLLDKHERRHVPVNINYTGFSIPNAFVVGYGLDFAGKYRNLSYIAVLNEGQ